MCDTREAWTLASVILRPGKRARDRSKRYVTKHCVTFEGTRHQGYAAHCSSLPAHLRSQEYTKMQGEPGEDITAFSTARLEHLHRYPVGPLQYASPRLVMLRGCCHAHNHVVGRPVVAHAAKYSARPVADLTVVQRRPFVPLMAARPLRGTAFHIKRTSGARPDRFFSCRRLGKRLVCCSWVRYSSCARCG